MKYGQELPKDVEKRLDDYIERVKKIKWFKPAETLEKSRVESTVKFALETFGMKAKVEYRRLETPNDWDAAGDAAWDAARDAAWGAARGAARDAAWDAARNAAWSAASYAAWSAAWDAASYAASYAAAWDAAWDAARDAAWDAARGAEDLLVADLDEYKKKYPNGNFVNLIPLWEVGIYPIGVVDGKFVIYIPPYENKFPDIR